MKKSRCRWLGVGMLLAASLLANLPSSARAQDAGLARGDAVVTGFSGIKPLDVPLPPGANPLDYFFIDLQGPSAEILALSGLGAGPHGQLAPTPVKRQIKAGQVGQVFAVTLDDGAGQDVPNIYLGATSAYGIQIVGPDTDGDGQPNRLKTGAPGALFMPGQFGPAPDGKPGTIWRVNGATGDVSAFAALPDNSGPGVGDVVFDKTNRQFFASDLDNGLIYRISSDGNVLDSFDHGVNGRPAKGLAPVADDGKMMDITSPSFDSQDPTTWGYTQKDRKVWGMAVHDGRLYYAVAGQVWSIGIGSDGDFAGDPRWELDATTLPGDGPITDMLFDGQGRMYLSQRGEPRGSYDYSVYADPGKSSVVRYSLESPDDPATPSVWVPNADEYAIGMRPEYRFADGGIALGYSHDADTGALQPGTCDTMLWSTGSRLRSSVNPDAVDDGTADPDVHGLQGNDASLVRPQNVPPSQAYYIDYDNLFGDAEKSGHMGDVEIWQPCDHQAFAEPGEMLPGFYPLGETPVGDGDDYGNWHPHWHSNLRLHKRAYHRCIRWGASWACGYWITVTNTGPNPYFGRITVSDHLPAFAAGATVGYSLPWSCGGPPTNFTCTLFPPVYLPVGASRSLHLTVLIPAADIRPGRCHLHNVAHITFAPGGSRRNTDPTDDTDGATAIIPSPRCERNNLKLEKRTAGSMCAFAGDELKCHYTVTVTNTGPGDYSGNITVEDKPDVGIVSGMGWSCTPAGANITCTTHPPGALAPGASVSFTTSVTVSVPEARAHHCTIRNNAKIVFAAGGTPKNVDPSDDADSAVATVPARVCVVQCPPGYEPVNGTCRQKSRPTPEHRVCPPGTFGQWPNCHRLVPPPERHPCRDGLVERGGRCVCPDGTHPEHGSCVPNRCPPHTVGQWPNCHRLVPPPERHPCRDGMIERGGRCVCPGGTHPRHGRCVPNEKPVDPGTNCREKGGVWRHGHCERRPNPADSCRQKGGVWRRNHCVPRERGPHCRPGTVPRGRHCVPVVRPKPHICPGGTVGRWPHCRRITPHQPLRRPHGQRPSRIPHAAMQHGQFVLHR